MKKIMFNDKYGLTDAVLEGRKTMTRRIIHNPSNYDPRQDWMVKGVDDKGKVNIAIFHNETYKYCIYPQYQPGEVVAVAQSYKTLGFAPAMFDELAGWNNKMFVKSYWIERYGHRIRITDIKVERLQDISDEDCICEGVTKSRFNDFPNEMYFPYKQCKDTEVCYTPRYAFQILIDKVSGRGTWESNPWVFAYSFELVK